MENRIKEIQEELLWNQYPFVNSDKREHFRDLLDKYKSYDKLLGVGGYTHPINTIAYWYVQDIVQGIHNRYINIKPVYSAAEVESINHEIKKEFEKEGRCILDIVKSPESNLYLYQLQGYKNSSVVALSWTIK